MYAHLAQVTAGRLRREPPSPVSLRPKTRIDWARSVVYRAGTRSAVGLRMHNSAVGNAHIPGGYEMRQRHSKTNERETTAGIHRYANMYANIIAATAHSTAPPTANAVTPAQMPARTHAAPTLLSASAARPGRGLYGAGCREMARTSGKHT